MAHTVYYEAFPTSKNIEKMRTVLVKNHGFVEKQNQYGPYFLGEASSLDAWQLRTVLETHKYKYRSYDSRYERDGKYRRRFFENNRGPYHCAYCGRRLKSSQIEVDHLVPVSKAKTSFNVRTWLHICGILNVNDPKNLVASCKKCNRRKSDKMGFWVVRGAIGRFKAPWIVRNVLVIIGIAALLYSICLSFPVIDFVQQLVA